MLNSEITIFAWNVPSGGLLKIIHEEYKYFTNQGYHVNVIFFRACIPPYYNDIMSDLRPIVITRSADSSGPLKFLSEQSATFAFNMPIKAFFSPAFNLFFKKKQYVIAHELASGFSLFFYLIFNRSRVATVLHDNPLAFSETVSSGKLSIVGKLVKFFVKRLLGIFRILVATTPSISDSLSHELSRRKFIIAEFGVNICNDAPNILKRKDILVMTKWTRQRMPEKYLQIALMLGKEFRFVLAGHWDEISYLNEIERMAEEINIQGANIVIEKDLSESEVHALYHKCRVFIRLSFSEKGTGQGILDAIGHGCVLVIGRELGGLSGIRDELHGYLVNSENLSCISEKIREIFGSDELSSYFSRNVYQFSNQHTWEEYGRILEKSFVGDSYAD